VNNIQDCPPHLRLERLNHRDNERILLGQDRYLFQVQPRHHLRPGQPPLTALGAKRPFIRKRDLVSTTNEYKTIQFPTGKENKTLSVCSGAGRALAKGRME
jgi:hypothetical protein